MKMINIEIPSAKKSIILVQLNKKVKNGISI